MIEILLATYNSERFLTEQLYSVFRQTNRNWKMLIRDGGSSDRTLNIIEELVHLEPQRVHVIPTIPQVQSSPQSNFSALLQASTAPYVMFSDHDDVWKPTKVADTMSMMAQAEAEHGAETPLLVYTDLCVVDIDLTVLNSSSFDYQNINPEKTELRRLLLQNVPTGCTMLMNRALVEKIGEIPEEAVMHDHWVALVASCFGKMIYLDKPTILYRQHGGNFYGAAHYRWRYFYRRYREGLTAVRNRFYNSVYQAEAFFRQYKEEFSVEEYELLEGFIRLKYVGWLERRRILFKHKIFKHGFRRNAGMFLVI